METAAQVARAPSGTQWTINAGGHEAVVVEVGGGLRTYGTGGVAVLDGYAEDELCAGSAGQVLAPWPNRTRDGAYVFDGQSRQLPITEVERHNAMHGLVNWARWRLVEAAADHVTIEHDLVPQPGYPWPLHLRTTWSVGADGLRAEHLVTNVGGAAAPFGLGTHPYVLVPGVPVDELTLRVPARSRLLADRRLLPLGAVGVAGTEYDFTEGRRLGATVLDTTFGDIEHDAYGQSEITVEAPGGRRIVVWADAAFAWWQVYSGDTLPQHRLRRALAIEPMTCPPDALRSGRSLVRLEPGESWRGTWGIRPEGGDPY